MKNKIKKKYRKFHNEKNKTGGGTNNIVFSQLEERIIALTGMETAVVGLAGREFGAENENMMEVASMADEHENEITAAAAPPPVARGSQSAPKRRRVTTQAMVLKELKEQRKVNEAFQGAMLALLKDSNDINAKRLKVEEELLQLKKDRQTIQFS